MNKRRKAYLRQLVAEKKKVPGLSEDDVRYIVNYINRLEKKEKKNAEYTYGGGSLVQFT